MNAITTKQERNTAFDFLKVFFLVLIIIHHCHVIKIHQCFYLGVDMFFMISGYLLYQSYEKHCGNGVLPFIKHRFKRLYPQYFTALLLTIVYISLIKKSRVYEYPIGMLYELLMIQNIGLPHSGGINYPCWYISVLALSTIIFCIIWFLVQNKTARQIIHFAIAFMFYFILFQNNRATIEQWDNLWKVISIPLLRGMAGISLGAFLCQNKVRPHLLRYLDFPVLLIIIVTMFTSTSEYIILTMIAFLVYSATLDNSVLSKAGKIRPIQFLIKHEYSIFLNHALIIRIFSELIKQKVSPIAYSFVVLFALIVLSVCLDYVSKNVKVKIIFPKSR